MVGCSALPPAFDGTPPADADTPVLAGSPCSSPESAGNAEAQPEASRAGDVVCTNPRMSASPSPSEGSEASDGARSGDSDAPDGIRPKKRAKRKANVSFGDVQILTHAPALDGCKVPSDGRAPIGLGNLESVDLRRMLSYDHERLASRKGIRAIPASERAAMLTNVGFHRQASIDLAEHEIAETREAAHEVAAESKFVTAVGEDLAALAPEREAVGLVDLWA